MWGLEKYINLVGLETLMNLMVGDLYIQSLRKAVIYYRQ